MKTQIIKAMKEAFSEKGYMASMSEVAKKVDIKTPSIYSHFKSKDEIIYLCIQDEIAVFTEYIQELLLNISQASAEKRLEEFFFAYIDYFKDKSKLRFWSNFDLITNLDLRATTLDAYRDYMDFHINTVKRMFDQGIASGEIDKELGSEMYLMYIVSLQGILRGMLKLKDSEEIAEAYYKKIWFLLWETIKTKKS